MHKQTVISRNVRRLLACMLAAIIIANIAVLHGATGGNAEAGKGPFAAYALSPATVADETAAEAATENPAAPEGVVVKASGGAALKISWDRVSGASGYVVYRSVGKSKFRKAKTLKGAPKTSWKNSGLKKNKVYRYKVRAYTKAGGDTRYSAYSYAVSAKPYSKKSKTANARKVSVDFSHRFLGMDAVKKIAASAYAGKGKSPVGKSLRWSSSDPSIVTAGKDGYIRSHGKAGVCYVYAKAHNGVTKKIKVTVGDFAHPASFSNLGYIKQRDPVAYDILMKYQGEFKDMAAFFESKMGESYYSYNYEEDFLMVEGLCYGKDTPYWGDLERIFKDTDVSMYLSKGNISIDFPVSKSVRDKGFSSNIVYSDYNAPTKKGDKKIRKIAPCWYFVYTNGAGGGKQEK